MSLSSQIPSGSDQETVLQGYKSKIGTPSWSWGFDFTNNLSYWSGSNSASNLFTEPTQLALVQALMTVARGNKTSLAATFDFFFFLFSFRFLR
jgi:hypothetical protein